MFPCSACSRMLCFSSSRWPLVVSTGTSGALPGPLWLWLSSGTRLMVFGCRLVIVGLREVRRENDECTAIVPGNSGHAKPAIVIARRVRAFQYSRAAGDKSRGRGVLDHPHARVMTI